MTEVPSEFFEDDEGTPDVVETDNDPVVESEEEYGFVMPSLDVPHPDQNVPDQNPGFEKGDVE